jgi:hypothetical protein
MKYSQLRQIIKEEISKVLRENKTVDQILDKISSQGKDSLTPEENEYLDKYSKGEKNISEPITLQNTPTSTSSIKAEVYPSFYEKETNPEKIKRKSKIIQLYDDVAREFLKPLINTIAQQLEISPKDIRTSFDGLWKENSSDLSIQIKLSSNTWKKPWTGNNIIMQTENNEGIVINNRSGIRVTYDKQPGATLPEVQDAYDDLYMSIKKEKIQNLINTKLSQFEASFRNYDLIAPNTPILYTGK